MKRNAFTLIELLIVVAIIAILAAIAVPNFLEAQTRAKVSRTKTDMRSISVAIESYAVDNNSYPFIDLYEGYSLPVGHASATAKNAGLTTPVAYLTSKLLDPFGGKGFPTMDPYAGWNSANQYWYWTQDYVDDNKTPRIHPLWGGVGAWDNSGPGSDAKGCKWSTMSKGPDQMWSHNNNPKGASVEVDHPMTWAYDPTNGSISWGNIVRVGP